jgi:hypothetical protein
MLDTERDLHLRARSRREKNRNDIQEVTSTIDRRFGPSLRGRSSPGKVEVVSIFGVS